MYRLLIAGTASEEVDELPYTLIVTSAIFNSGLCVLVNDTIFNTLDEEKITIVAVNKSSLVVDQFANPKQITFIVILLIF